MNNRHENEFAHNRRIISKAGQVWGRTGLAGRLRVERRATMIIERARIISGAKVLEIGCGTGELTARLSSTGADIIATDLDENFLERARGQIRSSKVEFIAAAGETLENFGAETFDVACGLSILHHLELGPALRNIYRVLKPGGRVVFSEPNMANPQILLQKNIPFLKRLAGDSPDETAFFRGQIGKILAAAGFKEVRVEPFDFLHPVVPDFAAIFFDSSGQFLEKVPLLREIAGSLFISGKK